MTHADFIAAIESMTVLELNELVKALEEEFGVSIPAEELEKMVTVGDVMKYIEANQN